MAQQQKEMAVNWLKQNVFTLWMKKGIDSANSAFVENISFDGQPMTSPRRALVQCRQIYSFVEALRLEILDLDTVSAIVENAVGSLVKNYSSPSGAYIHSVDVQGKPQNQDLDLYTQAFVLFGLARQKVQQRLRS